jgi:RNA polymerase sigma-70 factor (ECF subfamily)
MSLDEQLAKARAGDLAAFGDLVRAHKRSVYSLALRMLGRRDLAEDMAQEVFMQLHGKLQSIESGAHLAFWLRKVTAHRAIDQLRRRPPVEMTSLDDEAQLVSTVDGSDPLLQRQLRQLVLNLSPPARAVVMLRYQEDLDPLEIAKTLDMPVNTVKSHLKRSLETMRQEILGQVETRREGHST